MSTIYEKVASVLDMKIPDETESMKTTELPTVDMTKMLVPIELVSVPDNEVFISENPEIPQVAVEMRRIEEGIRQNDELLKVATAAVMHALSVIPNTIPQYQARAVESSAALFSVIADLNKFKVESQMKLIELKLKLDSYTRIKTSAVPGIASGTTIVFTGSTADALRAIKNSNETQDINNNEVNGESFDAR